MGATRVINTKGFQTIEAGNIRGGGGIVLATFNDKWKLHNHAAHTITKEYSTMKELFEDHPELTFY